MAETIRSSGVRVQYDEASFALTAERAPSPKGRRRRPGPSQGEESVEARGILAALAAGELGLVDTLEWQPRLEATPPSGVRRGGAPVVSPQPTSVEVEVNQDERAVMLVAQEDLYSWALPSSAESVPGEKLTRGAPRKRIRFSIEVKPERMAGGAPRRGFMGDLVYGQVKAWVFRFAAKEGVQFGVKLLERHVKEGPVIINSATDPKAWVRPADLSKVKLPTHRAARILLMVHGTFSSTAGAFSPLTATPWGQEFLKAALDYYDLVLGYDHRTLSEDPYSNAADLYECLTTLGAKYPPRIDAVCHSRGGLVLRSLVEAILPVAAAWPSETGKCVFVAATNGGTLLVEPDNWQTLIDLYTNLAAAASRALTLFPQTAAAGLVLGETVSGISALVKALASEAIGPNGVPGLAAMEPDGKFVTEINKAQPGQKGAADSLYYVVESTFEVHLRPDGALEPNELPRRLAFLLSDKFMDQLMGEANDLVVNTRSMTAIDLAAGDFVKDRLDFGTNSAVYHTNYFTRPEVSGALVRWLALPEPGQSHIAAPGAEAAPTVPASVDTNILTLESSATSQEAEEDIRSKAPSYVVVRRPYRGKTLHYALRSEELLGKLAGSPGDKSLVHVLDLHERDASPVTLVRQGIKPPDFGYHLMGLEGRPAGVLTKRQPFLQDPDFGCHLMGLEKRPAAVIQPVPASAEPQPITCNFQAAMDLQVAVGQVATIDVTISRETIAAIKGRLTQAASGLVKADAKLIVNVAPKANFVNQGESRVEVDPPATADPIVLSFDVQATDVGPGSVWVIFRQGVAPIVVLKLFPEVVATAPSTRQRQNVAQPTALMTVVADPPNTLLILEQRNGNELRFRYELRSRQLGVIDLYESKAIVGDRDAYIESLYKDIEDRWVSSAQDVAAFQEELRAFGGQLFDRLFPAELQQVLWANRSKIASILVISEEPFIPWELVHLKETPGGSLGGEVCFLGQMGLVRWLHGCGYPPSAVGVREGRARYIIPDYPDPGYKLPATQQERQYLEANFHATPIEPQPNPVREALKGPGAFDLLHFAGHGMAENDNIAHAQLLLEGRMENGRFIPVYLTATTVEQFANLLAADPDANRPMVVLNACQAGRAGYVLTRIGGFASAFLARGAGILVAALWSVGDDAASSFVRELYDRLRAGDELAKAVVDARQAAKEAGDATWLAYTVYGNPEAKLRLS